MTPDGPLKETPAGMACLRELQDAAAALVEPAEIFHRSAAILQRVFGVSGAVLALPEARQFLLELPAEGAEAAREELLRLARSALPADARETVSAWAVEPAGALESAGEAPGGKGAAPLVFPSHAQGRLAFVLAVLRGGPGELDLPRRQALALFAHQLGLHVDAAWRSLKMKELERMKSEFVTVVSHELRTPMTSIKSAIGLLADGTLGPINAEQKEYVELMSRNVDRLSALVRDVLDFSRIESGRLKLDVAAADARTLVTEAASAIGPRAREKGDRVEVELPPSGSLALRCDPDKIAQVLVNLAANAIQHNAGGIPVILGAGRQGDRIRFWVKDGGAGIAEKEHVRIFERFYQIRRLPGAGSKGAGLGLAIAKGFVEAHGSRIVLDSAPGRGAAFTFELEAADGGS